ncbi:radical SAM protein [Candidatus Puniceispirillum sp.]|nr:radical SAM protein [Alphaproteobacteria bacterium]MDC1293899.1 radical SAM protein [Candidatus Puniceispirillum sp.]
MTNDDEKKAETLGKMDTPEYIYTDSIDEFEKLITTLISEDKRPEFAKYRAKYQQSLNYKRSNFASDFPLTVHLELVNKCNLGCQMCYVTNHSGEKESLDSQIIDKIAKEASEHNLPAVIVGLGSESMLYKDVDQVFSKMGKSGVLDMFLYTNGTFLNDKMIDRILASGLTRVHISIDAATRETFIKVRKKDLYETVVSNIKRLVEKRDELGLSLPLVRVSFCVQDDNKHEIEMFKNQWRNIVDRVDFQMLLEAEKHVDELATTGKIKSLEEKVQTSTREAYCALPFNSLSVWADGMITPCCAFQGKNLPLGNIKFSTLHEVWHGDPLKEIRRQFLENDLNDVCKYCIAARDSESFELTKSDDK